MQHQKARFTDLVVWCLNLFSVLVIDIPFSLCLAQLVVYDLMSSLVLESVLCFGILLHPVFCSVDGV
jgi:hypothetical protein